MERESFGIEQLIEPFDSQLLLVEGDIQQGFQSAADRLVVLTEAEIFGEKSTQRKRAPRKEIGEAVSSLQDLNADDFVVHIDYGIGCYRGLHSLDVGESRSDFLLIEYRDDDRLYVPVHRLNLVQKYRGVRR